MFQAITSAMDDVLESDKAAGNVDYGAGNYLTKYL